MIRKTLFATGALIAAGLPALAGPVVAHPPTGIFLMRDSDGLVISVLHPIDYFNLPPGLQPGGIYYTFNGQVVEFSAGATAVGMAPGVLTAAHAGLGPTAQVGGVTYKIETDTKGVWLIDPTTGHRFAAERRVAQAAPDAVGHKVNPKAFALD